MLANKPRKKVHSFTFGGVGIDTMSVLESDYAPSVNKGQNSIYPDITKYKWVKRLHTCQITRPKTDKYRKEKVFRGRRELW